MHEHLYVIHGNDPWAMTCDLLEHLQPFENLPAHAVIGIKPNLVTATPAGHGATTHPQIVEAVIAFLQAGGFSRIKIIEGAWVGESTAKAFAVCGYTALAKKYGIPLKDLKQDEAVEKHVNGMDIQVCRCLLRLLQQPGYRPEVPEGQRDCRRFCGPRRHRTGPSGQYR
jgi:hypothetical protein